MYQFYVLCFLDYLYSFDLDFATIAVKPASFDLTL
jgi:hypothetical protein